MRFPRSTLFVVLLAVTALAVWQQADARSSRTPEVSSRQTGQTFLKAEYWTCPAENLAALSHAADSIWGPIFDELVSDGHFLGWSILEPTAAFELNTDGEPPRLDSIELPWNWALSWGATDEDAFDSAWTLVAERLRARFPDDPRPTLFCDGLTIVSYNLRSTP